jgi:hypothetical protein
MRFAHAALTAVAHGGDPQDRAASLATTGGNRATQSLPVLLGVLLSPKLFKVYFWLI